MDLHLDWDIDLGDRSDLTGELYRQLRQRILDGQLKPGVKLPPSRELAARLEVSRTTVVVAFERLRNEGFLVSRVGAGTFVSDDLQPAAAWLRTPARAPASLQPRAVWGDVALPETVEQPEFDFRPGIPDARSFPFDVWRRLVARELHGTTGGEGAYGDPAGHRGLRAAIARHVRSARGLPASADDITITNGTQQAVDLITRVLVDPGDQVAVEDPGYAPPRRLFTTLGARVVGVPVDGEGLVVEAIPARTRLVYVSPSHQFPLGTAMSLPRRLALLDWAQLHDAAIIEDDYDSEFRFDDRPVEPLHTLDPNGRVLYVGSFSKTMLASLRLGFVVAPPSVHRAIRAAKFVTDWHTPLPTQAALAAFLDDGWYARHVRKMSAVYQERHELVVTTLRREFAGVLEPVPGAAGLHLSTLARSHTAEQLNTVVRRSASAGVAVRPLTAYAVDAPAPPGLVVGYGAIATEDIAAGLRELRAAFDVVRV